MKRGVVDNVVQHACHSSQSAQCKSVGTVGSGMSAEGEAGVEKALAVRRAVEVKPGKKAEMKPVSKPF